MLKTALVNMPFAAVEYPSLALGLFKARLDQLGIPCDVHYLNITYAEMIGWQEYGKLVVHPPAMFAAEQLFAESLFGDQVPSDEAFYQDCSVDAEGRQQLQRAKSQVAPFLSHCLESVEWGSYDVIGFTSLFEQNLASLSLAHQIKRRNPDTTLVFGGPNFEGAMGLALHRSLPFIDYVCSGEADVSFPALLERLGDGSSPADLPGIIYRDEADESVYTGPAPLFREMDSLPIPDYAPYFDRLKASPIGEVIDPSVLVETSRGCWWGEKAHCTFCGLNGQGMLHRGKTAQRALNEILELQKRHQVSFVRMVDNILDHGYFADLLPELANNRGDFKMFYEVKANLKKDQIGMLADAGVSIVQAGIESLNSHTLRLMKKGTTALRNIQTMKWCKELQVQCDWNVLYGFPGERPEDYRQNAELATMLTHLDAPSGLGPIRLDRFSPNFDYAEQMGFKNVRPIRPYSFIYPFDAHTLYDTAYYFDFDYVEEIDDGGFHDSLHEAIWVWKNRKDQLFATNGGAQTVLYDDRPVATAPRLALNGVAKTVYELCDSIRTRGEIERKLEEAGYEVEADELSQILHEFIARRVMAKDGNQYLSLAVLTYEPEVAVGVVPSAEARSVHATA